MGKLIKFIFIFFIVWHRCAGMKAAMKMAQAGVCP